MNYKKIYDNIIERSPHSKKIKKAYKPVGAKYKELHHIIPKCLGGDDDISNLVNLTAKEHYICHHLLTKIYPNNNKLNYSFWRMVNKTSSRDQKRIYRVTSRVYETSRKNFSLNHPTKNKETKDKISKSIRKYYENHESSLKLARIECVCKCGCEQKFIKKITSKQLYIKGHFHPTENKEILEKQRKGIKLYLSKLTPEENKKRADISFHSCDHVKRGESISRSKKGKKTNQKNIEIIKYGQMSEEEFNSYIKDRKLYVQQKMKNRRKKYFDGEFSNISGT